MVLGEAGGLASVRFSAGIEKLLLLQLTTTTTNYYLLLTTML